MVPSLLRLPQLIIIFIRLFFCNRLITKKIKYQQINDKAFSYDLFPILHIEYIDYNIKLEVAVAFYYVMMARKKDAKKNEIHASLPLQGAGLIIASFIAIVIIKICLSIKFYSPFIITDELVYKDLAQRLLEGHLYSALGGYPPGYPVLLSVAYLISSDTGTIYHLMLAISAIVSTSIIFPAYYLMKGRVDEKVAIVSSVAVVLLPASVYYGFTLMSENLFLPMFLLSVLAIVKMTETKGTRWQILAAVSATGLYVTRSIGLVMIIGMVAAVLLDAYWHRKEAGVFGALKTWRPFIFTIVLTLVAWISLSTFAADISLTGIASAALVALVAGIAMIAINWTIGSAILQRIRESRFPAMAVGMGLIVLATAAALLVFGTMKSGGSFTGGNAYNVPSVLEQTIDRIANFSGLWDIIQITLNHLAYIIIATFFLLPVLAVTYFVRPDKNRKTEKGDRRWNEMLTAEAYVYISLAICLVVTVIFTIYFDVFVQQSHVALGRYLEPFVPVILLLAIIKIDRHGKSMLKNNILAMIAGYFIAILVILIANSQEIKFSYIFYDVVNNPAVYWLQSWSDSGAIWLPLLLLALLSLAIAYVTMKSGRAGIVLPVFVAVSALIAAGPVYANGLNSTGFHAGNDINVYLSQHSDRQTVVLIDSNMTAVQKLASMSIYAFWNEGKTYYTDDMPDDFSGQKVYLISTNDTPYEVVASDSPFKLYEI